MAMVIKYNIIVIVIIKYIQRGNKNRRRSAIFAIVWYSRVIVSEVRFNYVHEEYIKNPLWSLVRTQSRVSTVKNFANLGYIDFRNSSFYLCSFMFRVVRRFETCTNLFLTSYNRETKIFLEVIHWYKNYSTLSKISSGYDAFICISLRLIRRRGCRCTFPCTCNCIIGHVRDSNTAICSPWR